MYVLHTEKKIVTEEEEKLYAAYQKNKQKVRELKEIAKDSKHSSKESCVFDMQQILLCPQFSEPFLFL